MQALNVLKHTRILDAVQITVEEDRATMSKAAKEIRNALKTSGNGGGSSCRKKWPAGQAQQEFGCAPRQSAGRDSLVRENFTMARSLQARIRSNFQIFKRSSYGMHTECGG